MREPGDPNLASLRSEANEPEPGPRPIELLLARDQVRAFEDRREPGDPLLGMLGRPCFDEVAGEDGEFGGGAAATVRRVDRAAKHRESRTQEIEPGRNDRRHPDQLAVAIGGRGEFFDPSLRRYALGKDSEPVPESDGIRLDRGVAAAPGQPQLETVGPAGGSLGRPRPFREARLRAQKRSRTPARADRPSTSPPNWSSPRTNASSVPVRTVNPALASPWVPGAS